MNESRYRLIRPLAMGGMAELFLGVVRGAEGFEKPVALKRMLPHLAKDPAIAKMFLAEARLATHLSHQNIASVYDVGSGPEGLFLVMELVNGWDLGVLLRHASSRGQRFPPHLVAFIGAQVLAGLIHAYRRTHAGRPVLTAHRDVSPSNILISREGEVKVTDFGIARIEGATSTTQPGTFKGKFPYAAPETVQGQPATAQSDQFALGIILYELLAGRHPFGEDGQDPMAFAMNILHATPAPLVDVPAPLATVVMRSLSKAIEDRFPQPEEMDEALARYLAQTGEPATSHALASFIAHLQPPLTLVEHAEALQQTQSGPGPMDKTVERPPLSSGPLQPSSFALKPVEDWNEIPGGPALSLSGRRVQLETAPPSQTQPSLCVRCGSPLPSAYAPCDRCARELSPGLSSLAEDLGIPEPPAPQARPAAKPTSSPKKAPPPPAAPLPTLANVKPEDLQLAERAPRPVSHFPQLDEPTPWLRRLVRPLMKVLLLALVVGAVVKALPYLTPRLNAVRYNLAPPAQGVTLSISSEPDGATVTVDGTEIGTTPLFIDNIYPPQDIPVKVTLKGYKPWKGTFAGGQPVTLNVRLKR